VELETIDLATADSEAFLKAIQANYGSADHAVAMVIHNAGTIGQDGRKITVSSFLGLKWFFSASFMG
jgi:hypothetical protein